MHPRPEIENLDVCPHGGPDYEEIARLGFRPEEVLDFSVSANPFGPPAGITEAINSSAIDRYPDSACTQLRNLLASHLGIESSNIIVGNGSMEIIRLITCVFLTRETPSLIAIPTFGEYEVACHIAGSRVIDYRTDPSNGFKVDIGSFVKLIIENQPAVVFLCNPNNPTGTQMSPEDIDRVLTACNNSLLVVDEAYISFATDPWSAIALVNQGNVAIIRSMTKDYALAGLRLGYAVARTDIIDLLRKVCPPWNVNTIAQNAGAVALEDKAHLERCKQDIREAKAFLSQSLHEMGLRPLPSSTHFFLINVGNAVRFRSRLLQYGIMVRDCTSFGLPEYVRISPRSIPECERLVQAISEITR